MILLNHPCRVKLVLYQFSLCCIKSDLAAGRGSGIQRVFVSTSEERPSTNLGQWHHTNVCCWRSVKEPKQEEGYLRRLPQLWFWWLWCWGRGRWTSRRRWWWRRQRWRLVMLVHSFTYKLIILINTLILTLRRASSLVYYISTPSRFWQLLSFNAGIITFKKLYFELLN